MSKTFMSCMQIAIVCTLIQSLGCGKRNPAGPDPAEPEPGDPAVPENHAPEAVGRIPNQDLTTGEAAVVLDVSRYFRDVDGDLLRYASESSNVSIASAAVSGSSVTIRPVSTGSVDVTVTATDPDELSVNQIFRVHVAEAETPPTGPLTPPTGPLTPLTGPYTPLEWIRVSSGRIEIHGFSVGFIDCIPLDATVNGIRYKVHQSHWQWRENATSPWTEVTGTKKTGTLCSYTPKWSGEFRLVMEMSIDGIRGRYSSSNTITALFIPTLDECHYS